MTSVAHQLAPDIRRGVALTAVLLAGGAALTALIAVAAGGRPAAALGITPRVEPLPPGSGVDILLNNLRVVLAVLIAAGAVIAADEARDGSRVSRWAAAAVRGICDVAVAAVVAVNVALVAVTAAAYGRHVVEGLWLHGPVETFGFCVALSLYLAARRGQLTVRRTLTVAPAVMGALAVAALLETLPNP